MKAGDVAASDVAAAVDFRAACSQGCFGIGNGYGVDVGGGQFTADGDDDDGDNNEHDGDGVQVDCFIGGGFHERAAQTQGEAGLRRRGRRD